MKKVLITGASSGIGLDLAKEFKASGFEVWGSCRNDESQKTLSQLGVFPVRMDVTKFETVSQALASLPMDFDVLVNNAGIAVAGPLEGVSIVDWQNQFATNVLGVVAVTQSFLPKLRMKKGLIINISSVAGKIGSPMMSPYCASKFALEGLSDSLRRELRTQGIRVVVVEPGPILTPIWEKSKEKTKLELKQYSPELRKIYSREIEGGLQMVEDSVRLAIPPSDVSRLILKIANLRNPKTRYTIGKGMGLAVWLTNHLPDCWMDYFLRRVSKV